MEFHDLEVYKKLFKLALDAHDLTQTFPKSETYELGSQLRRSSNSGPANLAEGFGNKHTSIFTESISRARGEIRETIHHLKMAQAKKYIDQKTLDYFVKEYDICSRMLFALDKALTLKKK